MLTNTNLCNIHCFKGKKINIKDKIGDIDDLIIDKESISNEERKIFFSLIGNEPDNPEIALVGLSPGMNQLIEFKEKYNNSNIDNAEDKFKYAAKEAGFAKYEEELNFILGFFKLSNYGNHDFNNNDKIFITSLVKCACLGNNNSSKHFNPLKFKCASNCIEKRFLNDIDRMRKKGLEKIIFFGRYAQKVLMNYEKEPKLKGLGLFFSPHPSYLKHYVKKENWDRRMKIYNQRTMEMMPKCSSS